METRISRSRVMVWVERNRDGLIATAAVIAMLCVFAWGCSAVYRENNRLMRAWWNGIPQHHAAIAPAPCAKCGATDVTRVLAPDDYCMAELGEARGFSPNIVGYVFLLSCSACKRVTGYERTNDAPDDIVQVARPTK